jgi:ribosomal protein S10
MILLNYLYLYSFEKDLQIKTEFFSVIYKLLNIYNYSFFFFFKRVTLKQVYYRFYLIHINFYFLFIDYLYLVNYLKYFDKFKPSSFLLPIKFKSYSILRSPFVYSKSKEKFEIKYYKLFLNINLFSSCKISLFFFSKLASRINLENSQFWYKQHILF